MKTENALDRYLHQLLADGRSPHTIAQARRHVMLFVKWIRGREIVSIGHEDVARFLASDAVTRRADGERRKATSTNALRSSIRSFFTFVHAAGYTPTNPSRLVRRALCPPPRPRAVSDGDCDRLVAELERARTLAERRDRALFITLLRTGIRVGSAVGLDVSDVDLRGGVLRLRRIKGGGEDEVFVPEETIELLRAFVGERTDGPLFPAANGARLGTRQVHRRLQLCGRRAGITAVLAPHRLRHRFAMRIYAATGDAFVTARALCHRSVASTAVYAGPTDDAVRRALGWSWPG